MRKRFIYFRQLDYMDCGPTCLRMIASYYGKDYSLDYFRSNSYITRQGVNLLGLSEAAERIGFKTMSVKITYEQLVKDVPLPCILHWNQEHFVVLYKVKESRPFPFTKTTGTRFMIADPGHYMVAIDEPTLKKCWFSTSDQKGVALLMDPTDDFYNAKTETAAPMSGFRFLFRYLSPFRKYMAQLVLGMVLGSLLSLVFPFLTQSLVDYGIQRQNYNFIYLILFSQLLLFTGNIAIDLIRNWMLLHMNTRINVTIISSFLVKLMKLPISFFESKNIGDITQRIQDHNRIESFLTGASLQTLFSLINLVVFSIVLGTYDYKILSVFVVGSTLSIGWVLIFLRKRKDLDYMRFQQMRENQNSIYELITGMQEIKLNNCERARRWEWERIQAKLFKISIESLSLEQYQEVGSSFITQLKNIMISFMTALAVINHDISLGVMLSVSYIIGQMNNPLNQVIGFIRKVQDTKISLERLSEIHGRPNEETEGQVPVEADELGLPAVPGYLAAHAGANHMEARNGVHDTEAHAGTHDNGRLLGPAGARGLHLRNVSFRYGSPSAPLILKNLNLHIPEGKVTAIVGSSGSGKTTLLKLLLKFYETCQGEITVNGTDLNTVSASEWRKMCGTVMQEGYIFSDTIARNIAVAGEDAEPKKLAHAVHVANIQDYIRKLPLGLTTKIGNSGSGLSGGQRQRIFIARAVYKDPKFIFFDEATSALDANNEKIIMNNLNDFFRGRTVLVIAHRLSTVKNADQIIVMEQGEIREVGNHHQLIALKGRYFELVKNQLELEAA